MSSYIKRNPTSRGTPLQAGSRVYASDIGNGVVIGFQSKSDKPYVFFYGLQKAYVVDADDLIMDS